MIRREIEVEGVRLCAHEEGQGDPVLVLHGFTGNAESMQGVSHALRDAHRVVCLELVGHGQSEVPARLEDYSMSACARQIASAAMALDLDQAALLGYSMGGRAALAAAIAYPDRFAKLVLIGATAGIADAEMRAARVAADEALAARIETEGVERFVDEWMSLPIFASQARLGTETLERARAQRLGNHPRGLAQSLRGMGAGAQAPVFEELAGLTMPTLLVVGAEDEKFEAIAADLEARLPHARTAILANAGHAAHLEAPVEFARVVSQFLAGTPTRVANPAANASSKASGCCG